MSSQPEKPKAPPADRRVLVCHLKGSQPEADYLRDLAKLMGMGVNDTVRAAFALLGKARGMGEYPASRPVGRPPVDQGEAVSQPRDNGE